MLKMNPATGELEDDVEPEIPGGAVAQQQAAVPTMPEIEVGPIATGPDLARIEAPGQEIVDAPAPVMPPELEPEEPAQPETPPVAPIDLAVPEDMQLKEPLPGVEPAEDDSEPASPGPDDLVAPSPETVGDEDEVENFEPGRTNEEVMVNRDKLTREQIAERRAAAKAEAEAARIKAEQAKIASDLKIQYQKDIAAITRRGEEEFARRRAVEQKEYDKYRELADKGPIGEVSVANKILAGIAMLLGGRPAAAFIVGAVEGAEKEQKDKVARQLAAAEHAGKDAEKVRVQVSEGIQRAATQSAAQLDAAAARADAELAAQGVDAVTRAKNKDILALKQAALDARQRAIIEAHKESEAKIKEERQQKKDEAEIELAKARIDNLRARTAAAGKKIGATGAAAGRGGGGGVNAAAEMAKFIEEGVVGEDGARRPTTQQERILKANELGLKLDGKPSETTLASITKQSTFNKDQSRKDKVVDQRYELAEQRGLNKVISDFANRDDYKKVNNQYQQAKAIRRLLDNPNLTGVEAAGLVQKLDAIHRGGVATEQSIHQYYQRLGGTFDQVVGKLSQMQDGKLSKQQMHVIKDFAANLEDSSKQMLGDKHEDFVNATWRDPRFANDPKLRQVIEAQSRSMFGDIVGPPKAEKPAGPRPETPPKPAPPTTVEKAKALKWARANPNDPRAQSILQALGE